MKNKKIILAGGTGFMGQEMINYFGTDNEIIVLTRQLKNAPNNKNHYNALTNKEYNVKYRQWDSVNAGEWAAEFENADLIINLAGRSVNCRYTKKNKEEILNSRINATRAIGTAIQQCKTPPPLWINASSTTIYRHATDMPQDENTGEIKNDFSVQVCKKWEASFFEQQTPHTRKIALRMAITLGAGGVLIPFFNLLKLGLGGAQGPGTQMFSWIHIEDTCRMIEWINENEHLEGILNCCAPNPVPNHTLMKTLQEKTGKSFGLPAPSFLLKAGAFLIGTETELVLKSRWVIPTRILESGFIFKFLTIDNALEDIIQKVSKKQYQLF